MQGTFHFDKSKELYAGQSKYGTLCVDDQEVEAATRVLKSKILARGHGGTECESFEKEACQVLGVKHGLILNSGTSAIICALRGVNISPGDQVLVPSFTWIATASAVLSIGAIPIVVDVEADTLGFSVEAAKRVLTPKTRAVIAVHMNGVPCDILKVLEFCNKNNLILIEDACQAIGATVHGKMLGTFGKVGCWSFNANKMITCGEGGFLFTSDEQVFKRAKMSSDQNVYFTQVPRIPALEKYAISEVCAAIMRVQLKKLAKIREQLHSVKYAAISCFKPHLSPGVELQRVVCEEGECGATMTLIFKDSDLALRAFNVLKEQKVPIEKLYDPKCIDLHMSVWWDNVPEQKQGKETAAILEKSIIVRFNSDMTIGDGTEIGGKIAHVLKQLINSSA